MSLIQALLTEITEEAKVTRALLERVPLEKADWKPHEKSMELGKLASHVAEMPEYLWSTIETDVLDFKTFDYKPFVPKSTAELLEFFDKNLEKATKSLESTSEDVLQKLWTMRNGEQIYFSLPKSVVIRVYSLNHLIHHRAQLGVYLRILDVPLPGTYGPSADTMPQM